MPSHWRGDGTAALGERPAGACCHPLQHRHLSQPLCCESGEYVDGQKAGGKIRGLLQAAGYVRPYLQGAWPIGGEKSPAAQNGAVGLLCRKERRAYPLQPHAAGAGRGADDIEQLDGAECRAAEEGLCVRVRSLPQVRHPPFSKLQKVYAYLQAGSRI